MGIKYDLSRIYWKWERNDEDWQKIYAWLASVGLPHDTLVHVGHCTTKYGCKYGDPFCPVEHGPVRAIFYMDENTGELEAIPN